jgi:3-methyladenine DNA glycosylase AlkD
MGGDIQPRALRSAAVLERSLRQAGGAERAVQEKRYLKSELEHFGVPVPEIRGLTLAALRETDLDVAARLDLAEALWLRPIHECRSAATEILVSLATELNAGELGRIEEMIRQANTWALVDPLAVKVAGVMVERFPELESVLDRWVTDADFWIRRAALLALLPPLRRGEGDFERFGRYADALLDETEFFIRKAIGWVLREASKKDPERVLAWLAPRVGRAAGVTMREAVKYLPDEAAEDLMAAYRLGRASGR